MVEQHPYLRLLIQTNVSTDSIQTLTYPTDNEVMGYFRAIFSTDEVSERALALTAETIQLNQGNYTAWYYRRKLLFELHKSLDGEIAWLNSIGLVMQKNF